MPSRFGDIETDTSSFGDTLSSSKDTSSFGDISVQDEHKGIINVAKDLVTRFGKALWNTGVVGIPQAIQIKSGFGELSDLTNASKIIEEQKASGTYEHIPFEGLPIDQIPVDKRDEVLKARIKQNNDIMTLAKDRTIKQAKKLTPSLETSPAVGLRENIADIAGAGVGIAAQIAVFRKILPVGTPEPVIWEVQNQLIGGKPGMGLLYGGLSASIGGMEASEFAKAGAEALTFYGLARTQGSDPEEAAAMALVPVALRGYTNLKLSAKTSFLPEPLPKIVTKRPTQEVIVNAAYLLKDGTLVVGLTHPTIFAEARPEVAKEITEGKPEEGFTTSTGRFVGREEAATIAAKAKQTEPGASPSLDALNLLPDVQKLQMAKELGKEVEPTIESIGVKISGQLENVQDLRKTVAEPALKELRAKQAGQYKDLLFWNIEAGAKPEEAQTIALSGMKEAANVPEITPPVLSGKEWNLLFQKNLDVHTDAFDIVNTREALVDWRNGKILQDSQFQYLQDVLGKKTAAEMYYKQQDLKPFNAWDYVKMGVQFAKLPFAYDVQFFRQASSFAAMNPIKYVKGGYTALKSYVSEGFAERISNLTKANPNHNDAREHGINFLSEAPFATVAGKELAPEQFAYGRPVLQKMLTVGLKKTPLKKLVLTPVRGMARWYLASERSMIVSCNQFMQGLWDTQIAHWQKEGITGDKLYKYKVNYADTINTFMKILRAKTSTGRALQQASNFVLFSPSMTFSRIKRPYTLIANAGSRKYAAGLVATEIGKLFLISALTATMGQYLASKFEWARKKDGSPLITSSYDPTSTKWGTITVGDAHYDLGGGDTQFYRSLARLITGHYRNQAGVRKEAPRTSTLAQYAKSRETALLGVGVEVFTGRNFQGEKIWETPDWEEYAKIHKGLAGKSVAKIGNLLTQSKVDKALFLGARELLKVVLPQFTLDMFDAALDAGWGTVMSTGVADILSSNVQIYPEAASISMQKAQEKAAQIEYGKNWDELGPNQQKKLTQQYKEIADWEQQAKFERSEREVEIAIKPKYLDLPNNVSKILKQSKVPNPAVSRNIGSRFYLNDERFKKYQGLAAGNITDRITLLSEKEGWITATQEQKLTRLTEEIETAKELARRKILKEANLSASK